MLWARVELNRLVWWRCYQWPLHRAPPAGVIRCACGLGHFSLGSKSRSHLAYTALRMNVYSPDWVLPSSVQRACALIPLSVSKPRSWLNLRLEIRWCCVNKSIAPQVNVVIGRYDWKWLPAITNAACVTRVLKSQIGWNSHNNRSSRKQWLATSGQDSVGQLHEKEVVNKDLVWKMQKQWKLGPIGVFFLFRFR